MRPFAYERAADAGGAVARSPRRAGATYLGGGTNLVDLMKLGVETPERARRRHAAAARRGSRRRRGGGLRIGAGVRNSDLAARPRASASATRCSRRRCSPARPGSCATSRRSAATCSSARAASYFQDVTKPCNKRAPGLRLPGARGRPPQPRDPRRTRERASRRTRPTWPSRWPRSTPIVHVHGPRRRARRSRSPGLHRLPGDEPERDTVLEPGELITAVELPPLPLAAALGATARCATARRSRSPSSRSPPRSTSTDGTVARRAGSRSAASRTAPWRARRAEEALRGAARDARSASRAAAEAELAAGRSRCATTRFKVPLARNLHRRDAARPGGWRDDRRTAPARRRRARSTASRAARRSPARRATPTSTDVEGVAYACDRAGARSPAGAVAAVDAADARSRARACSPCSRTRTRRGSADAGDARARRAAVAAGRLPRPDRRGRRRRDARGRARGGRRSCASSTTPSRHDVELTRRPPEALHAREGQPELPDRHRARATSTPRSRGAPVAVDATYTTPAEHNNPMEPHATLAVWERRRPDALRLDQGAPARARHDRRRCSGSSPSGCA